jgi:hypothetical protein
MPTKGYDVPTGTRGNQWDHQPADYHAWKIWRGGEVNAAADQQAEIDAATWAEKDRYWRLQRRTACMVESRSAVSGPSEYAQKEN